jgi:hypothetical protein
MSKPQTRKFERIAMTRPSRKIVPLHARQNKSLADPDLPDLTMILADLKKILHEDGVLPQHKH